MNSCLAKDHLASRSIALKKHLTIISLDFTKAFDKIGIPTVIQQLHVVSIGARIINYVKNFTTNRKKIVKTDSYLSNTFPFNNGIPQVSPNSVILFLIAYNSLTNIISIPREIKFCAYADDFHLLIEHNKRKSPTTNLTDTLNQIDE